MNTEVDAPHEFRQPPIWSSVRDLCWKPKCQQPHDAPIHQIDRASTPAGGDAFSGKPASFDYPPEDCYLVAHDTGDGWALAIEDPSHEVIAYLMWPSSFGETQTAAQLQAKGFIIV